MHLQTPRQRFNTSHWCSASNQALPLCCLLPLDDLLNIPFSFSPPPKHPFQPSTSSANGIPWIQSVQECLESRRFPVRTEVKVFIGVCPYVHGSEDNHLEANEHRIESDRNVSLGYLLAGLDDVRRGKKV